MSAGVSRLKESTESQLRMQVASAGMTVAPAPGYNITVTEDQGLHVLCSEDLSSEKTSLVSHRGSPSLSKVDGQNFQDRDNQQAFKLEEILGSTITCPTNDSSLGY